MPRTIEECVGSVHLAVEVEIDAENEQPVEIGRFVDHAFGQRLEDGVLRRRVVPEEIVEVETRLGPRGIEPQPALVSGRCKSLRPMADRAKASRNKASASCGALLAALR